MIYDIVYKEEDQMFHMNGQAELFIGNHLYQIAKNENQTTTANSESHHLAILKAAGIIVNILEEDGSRMDW